MRSGIFILFFAAAAAVSGQTKAVPDPWIGSWKMNLARSKYESGVMPKSRTLTFEEIPGGMKATSDLLDEMGAVHIEFTAKYDGKDVPMRGPFQGNTIAVTRRDSYTFETTQKANGKVSLTTRFAVSRDGKTLTGTSSGLDPDGVKFTNVAVYDKISVK